MLDGFFKQYQVHDCMQLVIVLQGISKCLLELFPVGDLRGWSHETINFWSCDNGNLCLKESYENKSTQITPPKKDVNN